MIGYGFSLGNRRPKPKGKQRIVYIALSVVAVAVVLGMK